MSCVGNRPKSYATKPFKTGRSRMIIEQEKIPLTSSPDKKQDFKQIIEGDLSLLTLETLLFLVMPMLLLRSSRSWVRITQWGLFSIWLGGWETSPRVWFGAGGRGTPSRGNCILFSLFFFFYFFSLLSSFSYSFFPFLRFGAVFFFGPLC